MMIIHFNPKSKLAALQKGCATLTNSKLTNEIVKLLRCCMDQNIHTYILDKQIHVIVLLIILCKTKFLDVSFFVVSLLSIIIECFL